MTARSGVTLVELIVVLVLLSIVASVTALAMRAAPSAAANGAAMVRLFAARDSALRTGRPFTITVAIGGAEHSATAFPDGRVVADSAFHVDPLTGKPDDAAR